MRLRSGNHRLTLPLLKIAIQIESRRQVDPTLDRLPAEVEAEPVFEGDERKRIDELMTKLRSLVEALDIGLHVVTHLRKAHGTPHEEGGKVSINDLRGSGAIGHVSNIAVGAERNQQSEDDAHTMTLRVIKNRFSGMNGIAGKLSWKPETGRLLEVHSIKPLVEGEDF